METQSIYTIAIVKILNRYSMGVNQSEQTLAIKIQYAHTSVPCGLKTSPSMWRLSKVNHALLTSNFFYSPLIRGEPRYKSFKEE